MIDCLENMQLKDNLEEKEIYYFQTFISILKYVITK